MFSPLGRRDDMPPPAPADGSSTRGGSTSVRGRVRSPHVAKLQAYILGQLRAYGWDRQTDSRTDGGIV